MNPNRDWKQRLHRRRKSKVEGPKKRTKLKGSHKTERGNVIISPQDTPILQMNILFFQTMPT